MPTARSTACLPPVPTSRCHSITCISPTSWGGGLLWDGEWKITYETFRDMGLAYGVGMILIYLLVVAQFRSYLVPLIIMAPIPLTLIGVMPGHAPCWGPVHRHLDDRDDCAGRDHRAQQHPAGGFHRAAAGEWHGVRAGGDRGGAGASQTHHADGAGGHDRALFILDDPIFNGLAISLIFGILVSTLLTLVVIPLLYYSLLVRRSQR